MNEPDPTYRVLVRRALVGDNTANMQLHFEAAVLERYREAAGYSVIRTNTVGRVRKQGGWNLDFGIAGDDSVVHICLADLPMLPAEEREHWAAHSLSLPVSKMYLQMRMSPGSCFDDGDVRDW